MLSATLKIPLCRDCCGHVEQFNVPLPLVFEQYFLQTGLFEAYWILESVLLVIPASLKELEGLRRTLWYIQYMILFSAFPALHSDARLKWWNWTPRFMKHDAMHGCMYKPVSSPCTFIQFISIRWQRKEGSWGTNVNRMFCVGPSERLRLSCVWEYISRCVWAWWNEGDDAGRGGLSFENLICDRGRDVFGYRFLQYLEAQQQHLL